MTAVNWESLIAAGLVIYLFWAGLSAETKRDYLLHSAWAKAQPGNCVVPHTFYWNQASNATFLCNEVEITAMIRGMRDVLTFF